MIEVEGFILLGGASSRMGTDKARLNIGGKRFVDRIAGALSKIARKTSIVGAIDATDFWDLPNVADVYPKWGALGGLHAALTSCQAEFAAVVACDLPFVTGELFVRLASLSENFDSVVPVQADGRIQPLCALYRPATCLLATQLLIESGERRPRALLERVRSRFVTTNELQSLNNADLFFMNINTVEDFELAKRTLNSDE